MDIATAFSCLRCKPDLTQGLAALDAIQAYAILPPGKRNTQPQAAAAEKSGPTNSMLLYALASIVYGHDDITRRLLKRICSFLVPLLICGEINIGGTKAKVASSSGGEKGTAVPSIDELCATLDKIHDLFKGKNVSAVGGTLSPVVLLSSRAASMRFLEEVVKNTALRIFPALASSPSKKKTDFFASFSGEVTGESLMKMRTNWSNLLSLLLGAACRTSGTRLNRKEYTYKKQREFGFSHCSTVRGLRKFFTRCFQGKPEIPSFFVSVFLKEEIVPMELEVPARLFLALLAPTFLNKQEEQSSVNSFLKEALTWSFLQEALQSAPRVIRFSFYGMDSSDVTIVGSNKSGGDVAENLSNVLRAAQGLQANSETLFGIIKVFAAVEVESVQTFLEDAENCKGLIRNIYELPKLFTPSAAHQFGNQFAREAIRGAPLRNVTITAFLSACTEAIQVKCQSGDERAAVLGFLSPMLEQTWLARVGHKWSDGAWGAAAAAPAETKKEVCFEPKVIGQCIKSCIASGAVNVSTAAWEFVRACGVQQELRDMLKPGIKAAMHGSEEQRNICLTHLPASFTEIGEYCLPFFSDIETVSTIRPAAFLSLYFDSVFENCPSDKDTIRDTLCTTEVLSQLRTPSEMSIASQVAVKLAREHRNYAAFAILLARTEGALVRPLIEELNRQRQFSAFFRELWDDASRYLFGLGAKTIPPLTAKTSSAASISRAIELIARPLVLSTTPIVETLTQILLCCGHDYSVCGGTDDDRLFFAQDAELLGQYRSTSKYIPFQTFDRIFSGHFNLLEENIQWISNELFELLKSGRPVHIMKAACRAFSYLMKAISNDSACLLFRLLMKPVQMAVDQLDHISPLDNALTSNSVLEFIEQTLQERGLIKTYSAKPPKGMTEDDFDDMKRHDANALKAARSELIATVEKRRPILEAEMQVKLCPLVIMRLIGSSGSARGCATSVITPLLLKVLGDSQTPKILYEAVVDALTAMLSRTKLQPFANRMIRLISHMSLVEDLDSHLVAQAVSFVQSLRLAGVLLLDPSLFSFVLPLTQVMFKTGKGKKHKFVPSQTQHQILTIFVSNCGQVSIPRKQEACDAVIKILGNFSGLYRNLSQALNLLAQHIAPNEATPLLDYAFLGDDLVREACVSALGKTSFVGETRVCLITLAACANDTYISSRKVSENLLSDHSFTLETTDNAHIIHLLKRFQDHPPTVIQLAKLLYTYLEKFPEMQLHVTEQVVQVEYAAVETLLRLRSRLKIDGTMKAVEYLAHALQSPDSADASITKEIRVCGSNILRDISLKDLRHVLPLVHEEMQKVPTDSADRKDLFNAVAIEWQSIIACRTADIAFLEKVLEQQQGVLATSTSATVHGIVCDCLSDMMKLAELRKNPKLDAFVTNCIKQVFQSPHYVKKKAHAYGLAGCVRGIGLSALRKYAVIDAIIQGASERQPQRIGAMITIEAFAEVIGPNFEPYALQLVPQILDGVADKDPRISTCADDAAKAVMQNLSDIALRQLVPRLVKGIQSEQTKKRTPSLNLIGYVAFCSPQQLAATLPSIMEQLTECLFDANASVSNAAFNALKRVAGVVSNTEIKDHVDMILNAMRNPAQETEGALDALMYTRFSTVVDPASLALIVPVLCRGLSERSFSARSKAAQIVASTIVLVGDPKHLAPYAVDLLHRLEVTSTDPLAEVRTTSAKAISAIGSSLGGELRQQVITWAFGVLRRGATTAEKSGAAQALVELIAACGANVLHSIFEEISEGCCDPLPGVREGFIHIFVYAPTSFPPGMFQDFLPRFFPFILNGLTDPFDRVRDSALLAGSSIISLYGSRNMSLVLSPLLEGVISEVSTQRHSSLLLAARLLVHLVQQIRKKLRISMEAASQAQAQAAAAAAAKEEAAAKLNHDDLLQEIDEDATTVDGVQQVETAREAERQGFSVLASLVEQLGEERFIRLLSAMHLGRNEPNVTVRGEVTTAWQVCVASPRQAIHRVFPGIVVMLVKFSSSANDDCVQLAENCIEYTCVRLQETIEMFVDAFRDEYEKGGFRHKLGALRCMMLVVPFADSARLRKMGPSFAASVFPALQESDEIIRGCASAVIDRLTKTLGQRWIEGLVEEHMIATPLGIISILELVRVRPQTVLAIVFKLLSGKSELEEDDIILLQSLFDLEVVPPEMPRHLYTALVILIRAEEQKIPRAAETMCSFASIIPTEYSNTLVGDFVKGMKTPYSRASTIRCCSNFITGLQFGHDDTEENCIRLIVQGLGDADDEVRKEAAAAFARVMPELDKKAIAQLSDEDASDMTATKRAAGRHSVKYLRAMQSTFVATVHSVLMDDETELPALSIPKCHENLLQFYVRVLDYGDSDDKLIAIEGMQQLLQYSPKAKKETSAMSILGKCCRLLFENLRGDVATQVLELCIQFLHAFSGPRVLMLDTTLSPGMLGAALTASAEARTLGLKVTMTIAKRSNVFNKLLKDVMEKGTKLAVSPIQKASLCRFVSCTIRFSTRLGDESSLPDIIATLRTYWSSSFGPLAAAAGVALATSCRLLPFVSDGEFASLCDTALGFTSQKGPRATAGMAAVYGLITNVSHRLDSGFYVDAAHAVKSTIATFGNDHLLGVWCCRCLGALVNFPESRNVLKADNLTAILQRFPLVDELTSGAIDFAVENTMKAYPHTKSALEQIGVEKSTLATELGFYDVDMEDEYASQPPGEQ